MGRILCIGTILVILTVPEPVVVLGATDEFPEISEILERASQIAIRINDHSAKAAALRDIAVAHAQAGDIVRALQIAGTIQDQFVKASALPSIAVAQAEAGNRLALASPSWTTSTSMTGLSHGALALPTGLTVTKAKTTTNTTTMTTSVLA